MAGDWIKMRGNLWDDPRVGRISDLTGAGEAQVIGALYWLWSSADQHTENGFMPGLSLRQIDRKTGTPGLGAALVEIGWVEDGADGVTILNFSEHNGTSAKRRCTDAQRKANERAGVREVSASDADKNGKVADKSGQNSELEKEKRREEDTSTSLRSVEGAKRATRQCPKAFQLTEELTKWAREKFPAVDAVGEFEKFRDHTFKTPITDWAGAFRNWIRKAPEMTRYGASPAPAANGVAGLVEAQRWMAEQDRVQSTPEARQAGAAALRAIRGAKA
jgi:hypothetical protein